MQSIIAAESVAKRLPEAIRMYRRLGGYAGESAAGEKATTWLKINRRHLESYAPLLAPR